jgi:hypothetical protein
MAASDKPTLDALQVQLSRRGGATIEELNAMLGDVGPLAKQIVDMQIETRAREGEILEEILAKVTPLVSIIGMPGDSYYRKDIIILTKRVEAPHLDGGSAYTFSEKRLVLYENGSLYCLHSFGEWLGKEHPRPGWEMVEERELTAEAAVDAFGLPAIAEGLIAVLKEGSQVIILKEEELEARLSRLVDLLEVLK